MDSLRGKDEKTLRHGYVCLRGRFFSSGRVESPTHRHYWKTRAPVTQGGDAGRAARKLFIRFNYPVDEYIKKKRTDLRRKGERKERCTLPRACCVISEMANGYRRERDTIVRETLSRAAASKGNPLNLKLISEKTLICKERKHGGNYRDDRWFIACHDRKARIHHSRSLLFVMGFVSESNCTLGLLTGRS